MVCYDKVCHNCKDAKHPWSIFESNFVGVYPLQFMCFGLFSDGWVPVESIDESRGLSFYQNQSCVRFFHTQTDMYSFIFSKAIEYVTFVSKYEGGVCIARMQMQFHYIHILFIHNFLFCNIGILFVLTLQDSAAMFPVHVVSHNDFVDDEAYQFE